MLCGLRFLRRLSVSCSAHHTSSSHRILRKKSIPPPCSAHHASSSHLILRKKSIPPPCSAGAKPRSPLPLLLHRHRALCTRTAAATGEEAGTDPIFSPYSSVQIRCRKDDAFELSEALLSFGASSASMDEVSSFKDVNETCITSIFADAQDVDACISRAAYSIGLSYAPSYEISVGEHRTWVMKMQETFRPIEVTSDLWIIPKWSTPRDLQATTIVLDPGMAFGTGDHPTTKLCLLLLHGLITGGERILDYGMGSGVLGIAALKIGASLSIGMDIDPQAVEAARRNIALNKIDSDSMLVYQVPCKFHSSGLNGRTHKNPEEQTLHNVELYAKKGTFDIVIANLLLNPLLELAEDIVAYGKPGAVIGISGILSEQTIQITERYSEHLDHLTVCEINGWACISGSKRM